MMANVELKRRQMANRIEFGHSCRAVVQSAVRPDASKRRFTPEKKIENWT